MPVKSQILQACIKILVYSVIFIINYFNKIHRWLNAGGFVIIPLQNFKDEVNTLAWRCGCLLRARFSTMDKNLLKYIDAG